MDGENETFKVRLGCDPASWFALKCHSLFEAIITELPNALDPTQSDGIHDMRVATRRLRSSLRDTEMILERHPSRSASKNFKQLAEILGSVRDEDVAIDAFARLSRDCESVKVGERIVRFVATIKKSRLSAFVRLQKQLSVDFQQDLRHRFEVSLAALSSKIHLSKYLDIDSFRSDITASLSSDLKRVGARLYDPFDRTGLHKTRIAVKRLRYSNEFFSEFRSAAAKPISKELARLQGSLGDTHDRDVWIEGLSKHTDYTKVKCDPEWVETKIWLISELIKERTKSYREAITLLAEWQTRGFADENGNLIDEAK
ncbi:MAG TPA: CHAD domain-containing protein [Pyrinomonadaceae bacterium]|nr:CHAD domain-containing protein [Chloracidobacterium sp.]MBP9934860.1 CHAD domain-containing protein [Pyrinomonadaceae bacterium]MBK7803285.1 CHAD domain-containing protein [Chloracidobacterium sp.]MBK9438537.1 CHAD domain-containing protein [Chloracidobacterium sp.]MBL0241062.1 CHAD domain-containing protein [Chloracidobacterium sp.]